MDSRAVQISSFPAQSSQLVHYIEAVSYMPEEPHTLVFNREMGITHDEFFRILPSVMGPQSVDRQENEVRIAEEDWNLHIRLSEERERKIGSLRLPVTDIELRFSGFTEVDAKTFMDRFDLHFRKGGG